MEEEHPVGEAAGLAHVVGRHDQGHALGLEGEDHLLDLAGGAGVELGGRLIEEEDLGAQGPGARDGETLLLAARHEARRPVGLVGEAEAVEGLARAGAALGPAGTGGGQRVLDIGKRRAAQHDRLLEHHGMALVAGDDAMVGGPGDAPGGGRQQPVAEPQRQRLAGAVGADQHGEPAARDGEADAVDEALAPRLEGEAGDGERQDGGGLAHHRHPANRAPTRLAA